MSDDDEFTRHCEHCGDVIDDVEYVVGAEWTLYCSAACKELSEFHKEWTKMIKVGDETEFDTWEGSFDE